MLFVRDCVFYTARVIQHCIDQYPEPPTSVRDLRERRLSATYAAVARWFDDPMRGRFSKVASVTGHIRNLTEVGRISYFDDMLYRHCRNTDRVLAKLLLRPLCLLNDQEKLEITKALLGILDG